MYKYDRLNNESKIYFKLENKNFIIIERKTVEDLAASIKDGRYREQKARLLKHFSKNQILIMSYLNT